MLFDPTNPNNKFGYYKSSEHFKSYSLFETQEYAAKTGNTVEWNFNDEFFSTIDWTREPTESLKELYAERARQIRNKYDYLVLYFSGGSDSHNILETCYENDIYIDEILTHHTYDALKDKLSHTANMIEITLAAIPEAKRYIEKFPTTVHRIVDISELIKDYWIQNLNDLKFNFIYYNNYYVTPHHMVSAELPTILPEYKRLTDSGKRVCFIHGCDKPSIQIDQGKWYFSFKNIGVESSYSIRRQIEKTPVSDELFYWDPAAWKIIVKQSHVLRKFLYKNHKILKDIAKGQYKNINPAYASWVRIFDNNIPARFIKDAIYPHWRNDIVDIGKGPVTMLGVRNPWWTTSGLPGTKEHIAGVQHIAKQIDADTKSPSQITYFSKRYYF